MKAELIDRIRYVILKAPNRFPSDTGMTLEKAFEEMRAAHDALGNDVSQIEKLETALVCYKTSDIKQAIRNLQQLEGALVGRPA